MSDKDFDPEESDILETAGEASQGNPTALKWLIGVFAVLAAVAGLVVSTVYAVSYNLGSAAKEKASELTDGEDEESSNSGGSENDGEFWD